jgi:hypothetical protein
METIKKFINPGFWVGVLYCSISGVIIYIRIGILETWWSSILSAPIFLALGFNSLMSLTLAVSDSPVLEHVITGLSILFGVAIPVAVGSFSYLWQREHLGWQWWTIVLYYLAVFTLFSVVSSFFGVALVPMFG